MTMQQLRYFVELAHTHNYSIAAQRLFITQPTLSYSISQMEQELGVPLFTKKGRSNALTEYGVRFLHYAENALKTIDAGIEDLQANIHEHSMLKIGFLRYLGERHIPKLISEFSQAYPDYHIEYKLETGSTALLLEGLNAGRFDVAFCAPTRKLWDGIIKVSRQMLCLIVPLGHPLSKYNEITLDQALPYPFIFYPHGSSMYNILAHYLGDSISKLNIKFEIMEERIVAGFTAAGFGIGIVPMMDMLKTLPVKMIKIAKPRMERDIFMVPTETKDVSPVLDLFLRFAKAHPFSDDA